MSVVAPQSLPIALVIPTRDRAGPLARTLASLRAQGRLPAEIVIVDGSDCEATRQIATGFAQELGPRGCCVIWARAQELGAAAQRNQGVDLATLPIVGFCDDDIIFEAGCIELLWRALDTNPHLGGVNAMITNQRYQTPGSVSRAIFRVMAGSGEESYAGRVWGPAVNLLPEDRGDLPEVVPVDWLNLGCTLYRREALPRPVFPVHFKGASLMEDVTLSINVGRNWKLANARTARIYHDSQAGSHKCDMAELARMELVNRHYVMTRVLDRRRLRDYAKFALWETFQLAVCAFQKRLGREFWLRLKGKLLGACEIIQKR